MLLCLIFNIYPIVPAAIPTLVMHIVTVDRSILRHPVAATQAAEIGVILIRCHHTCAVALGTFHLNAGGERAILHAEVGMLLCPAKGESRSSVTG